MVTLSLSRALVGSLLVSCNSRYLPIAACGGLLFSRRCGYNTGKKQSVHRSFVWQNLLSQVSSSYGPPQMQLKCIPRCGFCTHVVVSAGNCDDDTSSRLRRFREELQKRNLDAYIIPSEDPHMSEYPPSHYSRREYISGFTGSAGVALITRTQALLFTDGRYFEQAER